MGRIKEIFMEIREAEIANDDLLDDEYWYQRWLNQQLVYSVEENKEITQTKKEKNGNTTSRIF